MAEEGGEKKQEETKRVVHTYPLIRVSKLPCRISWHYPLKRQCCRKRKYFRFGAIFTVRRRYLHHKFMFCANSHKIRDLVFC